MLSYWESYCLETDYVEVKVNDQIEDQEVCSWFL